MTILGNQPIQWSDKSIERGHCTEEAHDPGKIPLKIIKYREIHYLQ